MKKFKYSSHFRNLATFLLVATIGLPTTNAHAASLSDFLRVKDGKVTAINRSAIIPSVIQDVSKVFEPSGPGSAGEATPSTAPTPTTGSESTAAPSAAVDDSTAPKTVTPKDATGRLPSANLGIRPQIDGLPVRYALTANDHVLNLKIYGGENKLSTHFASRFLGNDTLETSVQGAKILNQTFGRLNPNLEAWIREFREYQAFRGDEFKERDYLPKMTAILTEELNFARKLRKVRAFEARSQSGVYNFERRAFPVELGHGQMVYLSNGQKVALSEVTLDSARARALREATKTGDRCFGFGIMVEGNLLTHHEVQERGWSLAPGSSKHYMEATKMLVYLLEWTDTRGKGNPIVHTTLLEARDLSSREAVAKVPPVFSLPE